MGFVMIVDGPNLINDLHGSGKGMNYILETLSFPKIHSIIQRNLNIQGLRGHPFVNTYFVCSDRGRIGEFKGEDRQRLLQKLKNEKGVTVDEIKQSHGKGREEQVDMSVFIRMLEMGPLSFPRNDPWRHVVLVASDSDYVPAIRLLSKMGTHTIVVGFREIKNDRTGETKKYPIELINESHLYLEMSEILSEMENSEVT
jgi:hypothetical protein